MQLLSHLAALLMDAAMSDIDRNSTKASSLDGRNPRRVQKSAASTSTVVNDQRAPADPTRSGNGALECMLQ